MLNDFDINNSYSSNPNFTILAPGSCNSKCEFCFWNRDEGKIKPDISNYRKSLKNILDI
jgi:sulfatase maturation enzyme AslB (radical SAM superfamily)